MKKFTKLLAVLLAIAVIVCPMVSALSVSADATPSGTYKLEQVDGDTVKLTINSTDGFLVYKAVINCNKTLSNLAVESYTVKSPATTDGYNYPAIGANTVGNDTTILVSATDGSCLDLYTQVVITMDVTTGSDVKLTNIQAADEGDTQSDPTLLEFPGVDVAANGVIDTESEDYEESAVVENVHTHNATATVATEGYLKTPADCNNAAVYYKSCSECGLASTETFTSGSPNAHVRKADSKKYPKTAATCTTDAEYWDECTNCGDQMTTYWTDTDSALGHNMTSHAANGATCTADGNSAYWSCDRCNKFFSDDQGNTEIAENSWVITSLGHTPSDTKTYEKSPATCKAHAVYYQECSVCNEKLDTTWTDTASGYADHTYGDYVYNGDATCTKDGTKTATCTVCETATDTVADPAHPMTGHNWDYTSNGDGTHNATCLNGCDATITNEACDHTGANDTCSKCEYVWHVHDYGSIQYKVENGNCISYRACSGCDEDEVVCSVANPTVTPALVVASGLAIRFRIPYNTVTGYTTVFASIQKDTYDVNNYTGKSTPANVTPTDIATTYKQFEYSGIASYEMTCNIYFDVYGKDANANLVLLTRYTTTLADEFKSKIPSANANYKIFYADVLRYGAASQKYMNNGAGYNITNLPDVGISGYSDLPTTFTPVNISNGVTITPTTVVGNSIFYRMRFKIADVNAYNANSLKMTISYTNANAQSQTDTFTYSQMTNISNVYYQVEFSQLPVYYINQPITIKLYDGDTEIGSLQYSFQTYAQSKYNAALGKAEATSEYRIAYLSQCVCAYGKSLAVCFGV